MNATNPFANVFSQNPFMNMTNMNMGSSMQNPFTMWQDMWQQAAKNMTTMCGMPTQTKATLEPFAFSPLMQGNPMAMYQQAMEFWQNMLSPTKAASTPAETPAGAWPFVGATGGAKPKVTMMTVELGDMTPYIKQATDFMQQWQNMWLQNAGGNR